MPLQIVILSTSTQPDKSFSASGVFWLVAPYNNIVPRPKFQSSVPFIDQESLFALRSGTIIEETFSSGLFAEDASVATIQSTLQEMYNAAQVALNSNASALNGLIGAVFDGYSWGATSAGLQESSKKIQFSNAANVTFYWSDFKATAIAKDLNIQYVDFGDSYKIFAFDGPIVYSCLLIKSTYSPTFPFPYDYPQSLNDSDLNDFVSNFKSLANANLNPQSVLLKNVENIPVSLNSTLRSTTEKTTLSRATVITHDWTDPTTWYETSIRITDEVAVNSGDNTIYNLAHQWVIDNYHSKMSREDFLKNNQGQSLRVAVKVNDVVKTEQDPHYGTGGDFLVGYEDGYIQFLTPLAAEDVVKVTYNYMVNSIFTLKPPAGKKYNIVMSECQFSMDGSMEDSIRFQTRGKVDVFAPQLVNNPYPSGTIIPIENPVIYKAYSDFLNDAMRMYPESKPVGGTNWRASPYEFAVFNWDYVSQSVLHSDYGMEVQLRLDHDQCFDGWYATMTFYCTVENC